MENKKKVLITGVSGFLGSHVARVLINNGYSIIALKRDTSNLERCQDYKNNIHWISLDNNDWQKQVIDLQPNVLIHAAWVGVEAKNRDNWESQIQNIEFTKQLLEVAVGSKISTFIGFGSQAEYGFFSGKIDEQAPIVPTSAYGVIKHTCAEMIRLFCSENQIKWYWLRLFSFFGEGEADNWLIPSVIKNVLTKDAMDFTLGEQKYAYLYVEDLAKAILNVVQTEAESGVYNLSSSNPVTLKEMITMIRDHLNPAFQLNFGALPYRPQQSMHIEGNTTKFQQNIAPIDSSDFYEKLYQVIDFYKKKYESE